MSDDRTLTRPERRHDAAGTRPFLLRVCRVEALLDDPCVRYALGPLERVEIGRGAALSVPLGPGALRVEVPDPWMSARHATLERVLGQWVLRDLGAKNGTAVNGATTRGARLSYGDVIELGATFLVFRALPLPDAPAVVSVDPSLAAPDASLTHDPASPEELALHVARWLRARDLDVAPRFDREVVLRMLRARALDLAALDALLAAACARPDGRVALDAPTAGDDADAPRFAREGAAWCVRWREESARLRDLDGVRYLAWLVEHPRDEVAALDLMPLGRRGGASETAAGDATLATSRGGDAGPMLDAEARSAYQQRVASLRDEEDEARAWGDRERAAKARAEIEFLAAELSRAVGLGGRIRAAGSATERGRVNVTIRIRAAIRKIAEQAPTLGHHLETCVRTGTACQYLPPPRR